VVRSERWGRLREDFTRAPPPGYDAESPWDFIIGASVFGQEGHGAIWWQTHFLLPASLGISSPAVAGMPRPAGSSQQTSQPPAKQRKTEQGSSNNSNEVCQNWNNRAGKCKGQGPCPAGRSHGICSVCGGPHRAKDRHGAAAGQSKGDGKGKKGKGKKGQDQDQR